MKVQVVLGGGWKSSQAQTSGLYAKSGIQTVFYECVYFVKPLQRHLEQ